MREEPEKGALAHGELAPGARRLACRRSRRRHPSGAEVPGVPDELARLLAEEKEEGVEESAHKVKEGRGDVDEEVW